MGTGQPIDFGDSGLVGHEQSADAAALAALHQQVRRYTTKDGREVTVQYPINPEQPRS